MEYILAQERLYEVQFDDVLCDQVEETELEGMWSLFKTE